jgi:sucrose phosphorylase
MKNSVQLCTYADRFGMGSISTLHSLLQHQFKDVFGGVHILPFYFPIDGADAGFDPIDHTEVDQRLGSWADVKDVGQNYDIMADVIVNHMSAESDEFLEFKALGDDSQYADLFLTFDRVFPNGASETDLVNLYRPRPGLPFSKMKFDDGRERMLWTTFTAKQIDIDVSSASGQAYLDRILERLHWSGVNMIRLDAAGYAIKKAGSKCFMTDETFAFIESFSNKAKALGIDVLVEIHAHYLTQVAISKRAGWVYDFALPPLVLHTLIAKDSAPLQQWLAMSPRNAVTVLDTHDGIGIIDIAAEKGVGPGLLSDEQVDQLVEAVHDNSKGQSRLATGAAASNVDLYQVNCTFYDALARDEQAYLLARLIQFFAPGVPQVYYVGLLAGENDMALLQKTGVGRDINRHYYSGDEVETQMQRPVVQNLIGLMKFRNQHPAFQTGEFECHESSSNTLKLAWQSDVMGLDLTIDLADSTFEITETQDGRCTQSWSSWQAIQDWVASHSPLVAVSAGA